jgi:hypothetical protein
MPDRLIHAAGSQDNFKFDREHKAAENVHIRETPARRVQQDFVSVRHSITVSRYWCYAYPLVYLDDYMLGGGGQGAEQELSMSGRQYSTRNSSVGRLLYGGRARLVRVGRESLGHGRYR